MVLRFSKLNYETLMNQAADSDHVVKYQFQVSRKSWEEWKNTVPRSKNLDVRIRELLNADTDGRVLDPDDPRLQLDPDDVDLEN